MGGFQFEFEPELEQRRAEQARRSEALEESLARFEEWRSRREAATGNREKVVQRHRDSLDHLGKGALRNADLVRETERLTVLQRMITDLDRKIAEITRDLEWAEERAAMRRQELDATVEAVLMLEKLRAQHRLEWSRAQRKREEKALDDVRAQAWQKRKDES